MRVTRLKDYSVARAGRVSQIPGSHLVIRIESDTVRIYQIFCKLVHPELINGIFVK